MKKELVITGSKVNLKNYFPFKDEPLKFLGIRLPQILVRPFNKIRFLRIYWATGQIKNKWLYRILDIYYSLRFSGYYEGEVDSVRIWSRSRSRSRS